MLAFAAKSSLVLLVAWGITAAMRRSSTSSVRRSSGNTLLMSTSTQAWS